MQPRMRSNSQSQGAGGTTTPVRYQGTAGRNGASTVGRSSATRLYTPQTRPGALLATPPSQTASTLRRGRRQSETGVGVGAWARGEQSFVPPLASSHSLAGRVGGSGGSIVAEDALYTPVQAVQAVQAERRRPESRLSAYSAASTPAGYGAAQSSGKQPVLVRSVRVDLKVVPPELDAARAERRGGVPPRQQQQQQAAGARVRGRMDVSVHVLHRGEQTVDLLAVGESLMAQRSRSRSRSRSHRQYGGEADAWPLVERTACVVAGEQGAAGYAESVASPVLSPVLPDDTPTLSLRRVPTNDSQASPVLARRPDPIQTQNQLIQNQNQNHQRPRPASLFHVDQLSPYPPAPSTPSPPTAHLSEQQQPADMSASRYETHTQASYARAQARVSDRVALYNELIQSQMRAGGPQPPYHHAARRTMSVSGAERYGGGGGSAFAAAHGLRPASAMGESAAAGGRAGRLRSGLLRRAATSPERPHSSMGLMSPTGGDLAPAADPAPAPSVDPALAAAPAGLGLTVTARRRSSSIASSDAPRDETAASSDLCRFETDHARGVLVARLSEARRYRLTVWFSLPASSEALLPSSGAAAAWECGSASMRGIPRALSTRVRLRLPHRLPPVDFSGGEQPLAAAAGCFFQARMLQPPLLRIQPQGARVVDARSASQAARSGRAVLPVFSPPAAADASMLAQLDGLGEPGGWLATDDSDAEPGGRASCGPSAAGAETEAEAEAVANGNGESVLDRKLRRFIDEYGRRGSFSLDAARPPLVGDSEADRRAVWARFVGEHPDYDFSRTEMFSFRLSMVDSLGVTWAPHAEPGGGVSLDYEHQHQHNHNHSQHQPRLVELSPLLSQETMPFEQQFQLGDHPPALGFLETINSVEPSPAVGAPPESLAFEPPVPILTPPVALPSIEAVSARVVVRPGGLCLSTTVVLRHAGCADVALDFAPVRCAIGASRYLALRHRSVAVDGCDASFPSGGSAPGDTLASALTSRLHVQLPNSAAETVELVVQSELSLAIPLSGMILTQSFYIAVPTQLVSLVLSAGSAENSARAASICVVSEADAWVHVDSKNMDADALSLLPSQEQQGAAEMYEVITIARRGSPVTAAYIQRLADAHAFAAAAAAAAATAAATAAAVSAMDVRPALASSVGVSVDIGCAPADDRLCVRVRLECSVMSFRSWREQMAVRFGGASVAADAAATTACLAVVVPDTEGGQGRWCVDVLELAADSNASSLAGQRATAVPVQSVVGLGGGVVAVPLSQTAASNRDGLTAEVTTDSLVCAFTATMALSDLANGSCLRLRLPAPLFDVSSLVLPPGSTNMRFAQACDSLLTAAPVTVSLPSGGTPLRMDNDGNDGDDGSSGSSVSNIYCSLDASPGGPVVSQKLQVGLTDLAGLRLHLRHLPPPPVTYATKATYTYGLTPKAESVVADASDAVVHEEHEEHEYIEDNDATAAVSCASSAVLLPLQSPEPPVSAAAVVDSLLGDAMSVYSVVSNSSLASGTSNTTGSLRNRHGSRIRSTVPSESEPLLGRSTESPDLQQQQQQQQQSMMSRVWGWTKWTLGLALLMAVIGGLLFAVSEFTSSVSASAQNQIHHEPSPSVQAVPLHTDADSQSMQRNRLFRVKSTDIYALARDERRGGDDETLFVVSNDGSHSFNTVAGDTSSLLGWVFQVFIEPILEAIGANAY
ncbi:hypothetical protein LPJ53_005737 [Coemansia erecta]|uniref:Uncharacterized protein n=1 Tax=Coemansia erecta TaxID=147472 RepID=A0A9W7XV18_9FUNG|nr:hypothetical protein LPJ53_005737 [Coemansia erecta]